MNDIKKCKIQNYCDENNNPTSGGVSGVGLDIVWQNGPAGS